MSEQQSFDLEVNNSDPFDKENKNEEKIEKEIQPIVPRDRDEAARDQGIRREPVPQEDWDRIRQAQEGLNTPYNPDNVQVEGYKTKEDFIEELGLDESAGWSEISKAWRERNDDQ